MAPSLRRLGWPLAAAAAFAFLLAFAMHGKRPEAGLAAYRPAGFLTAFEPQDAIEVTITSAAGTRRFARDGSWSPKIDEALRLLRDAAPMRVMTADEVAGQAASAYGLDKGTAVAVRARSGRTFAIRFGAANPLGSGRYVKVDGVVGVPILPSHVGDAWEQLAK